MNPGPSVLELRNQSSTSSSPYLKVLRKEDTDLNESEINEMDEDMRIYHRFQRSLKLQAVAKEMKKRYY